LTAMKCYPDDHVPPLAFQCLQRKLILRGHVTLLRNAKTHPNED
jgi:hypothetical protein